MKKLATLLLVAVMLASSTGCSQLGSVLHAVDSAVNDSGQALSFIQATFNLYASQHAVTPAQQQEFGKLLANAELTLRTGTKAVTVAHDIDQQHYDAAFADFRIAYRALADYLVAEGITPSSAGLSSIGAARGAAEYPDPAVIGLRVQ